MEYNYTVKNLIDDVKIALKAGAHFSALALSFTLVSECSKVEYPDEWFDKYAESDEYMCKQFPSYYKDGKYIKKKNHDKERFIMWIDDWDNAHNCDESIKVQMKAHELNLLKNRQTEFGLSPYINGELLYQLRCHIFHEASNAIDFQSQLISDEGNKKISSDSFTLSIDNNNAFDIHITQISTTSSEDKSTLEINVNGLVYHILDLVELYYERKNGIGFNTIHIRDNRLEK